MPKINELSVHTVARSATTTAKKDLHGKNHTRLLTAALLSASGISVDTLRDLIPRATFFRLKKDLKAIGVHSRTSTLNIPMPRIDYLDYRINFKNFHK